MLVMLANVIFSLVIWKSGNYSAGRYVLSAPAQAIFSLPPSGPKLPREPPKP